MITLEGNSRFKEERETFQKKISGITNDSVRREAETLLKKLLGEVRVIDSGHSQLADGNGLPEMVHDSKNRIIEIRTKLNRLIEDWESSKKV